MHYVHLFPLLPNVPPRALSQPPESSIVEEQDDNFFNSFLRLVSSLTEDYVSNMLGPSLAAPNEIQSLALAQQKVASKAERHMRSVAKYTDDTPMKSEQILVQLSDRIEEVPMKDFHRIQNHMSPRDSLNQGSMDNLTPDVILDQLDHILGESIAEGPVHSTPSKSLDEVSNPPQSGKFNEDASDRLPPVEVPPSPTPTALSSASIESELSKDDLLKFRDYVTIRDSPHQSLLKLFFSDSERGQFETLFKSSSKLVQYVRQLQDGPSAKDFSQFESYVDIFIKQPSDVLDTTFPPDQQKRLGDIAARYLEYTDVLTEKGLAEIS